MLTEGTTCCQLKLSCLKFSSSVITNFGHSGTATISRNFNNVSHELKIKTYT